MNTIRSVLLQDYPDFELLVVDQSVEHTREVENFLRNLDDPRYSYRLVTPRNLPAARNFGLAWARGEIVIYIDDDVLLDPGFIDAHVKAYERAERVSGVGGRIRTSDKTISTHLAKFLSDGSLSGGFNFPDEGELDVAQGCNMSFRRSAFKGIDVFDPSYEGNCLWEEYDVCFQLRHQGHRIRYEPRAALDHLVAPAGGCRVKVLWDSRFSYQNETLFYVKNLGLWFFFFFFFKMLKNHVLPHKRTFLFWTRLKAFSTGVPRGLWFAFFPRKLRSNVVWESNRTGGMTPSASKPWPVSAYIPCYNNATTVGLTIQGIQNQTYPVDELFVVDDGSTDNSVEVVEGLGVRVIRMGKNKGRGAVRAQAMEAARNEFVLCCDATNRLPANFLETALKWFSSEQVVGVYGRWIDRNVRTAVDRWRARHLFQQEMSHQANPRSTLCTHGAMVRKSAVSRAGNYNSLERDRDDFDLGIRLLAIGDVVFDPALEVESVAPNSLFQVMERYTRWNRALNTPYTLSDFIVSHVVAWRILIPEDLEKRDWRAALISATLPYFAVAYAHKRSLNFSAKPALKKAAPIETKN